MMRISIRLLLAAMLAAPQAVTAGSATASFQVGLRIVESCVIDSRAGTPSVSCRHASAWRLDGATITF